MEKRKTSGLGETTEILLPDIESWSQYILYACQNVCLSKQSSHLHPQHVNPLIASLAHLFKVVPLIVKECFHIMSQWSPQWCSQTLKKCVSCVNLPLKWTCCHMEINIPSQDKWRSWIWHNEGGIQSKHLKISDIYLKLTGQCSTPCEVVRS